MNALLVFLGGGLGSLARYGLSVGIANYKPTNFPLATFTANLLSCIIIGITVGFFSQKLAMTELKSFLVIGFCGGFSTFSTFSNETLTLFKEGNYPWAMANILLSLTLCIGVIYWLTLARK